MAANGCCVVLGVGVVLWGRRPYIFGHIFCFVFIGFFVVVFSFLVYKGSFVVSFGVLGFI